MNIRRLQLRVVSFSHRDDCEKVLKALSDLDYPIDISKGTLPENELDRYDVVVFVVRFRENRKSKVISCLNRAKADAKPVLGVFYGNLTGWDNEMLECFTEILTWPVQERELAFRVRHLLAKTGLVNNRQDDSGIAGEFIDLKLIGKSPPFVKVLKRIKKFAKCDAPVLIEGETGTGKEIVARAIHYISARRDYPFVPVNCGAIPDNLMENELFGHEKGAYTDAASSCTGLVAQAEGGTLFIDEVETLTFKGQITLLRFLQEREYKPLGSDRRFKANVRIIAASNAGLSRLAVAGKFRHDFLYRLNILYVLLPSLRERIEDIRLLVEHFLNVNRLQYNQPGKYIHPGSLAWMKSYDWPGNIRELENVVHREFLLAEGSAIHMEKLSSFSIDNKPVDNEFDLDRYINLTFNEAKMRLIEEFEKSYLCQLMRENNGNVTCAARQARNDVH